MDAVDGMMRSDSSSARSFSQQLPVSGGAGRTSKHTRMEPVLVHGVSSRHAGLGVGWSAPPSVCNSRATRETTERGRGGRDATRKDEQQGGCTHNNSGLNNISTGGTRHALVLEQQPSTRDLERLMPPQNGWVVGVTRSRSELWGVMTRRVNTPITV